MLIFKFQDYLHIYITSKYIPETKYLRNTSIALDNNTNDSWRDRI